ncbi:hypothetical protein D3C85_1899490 [compost metagenome]
MLYQARSKWIGHYVAGDLANVFLPPQRMIVKAFLPYRLAIRQKETQLPGGATLEHLDHGRYGHRAIELQ